MRKLIFAINITLDGCCDHTRQIANEEVNEYFSRLLLGVDELVYGRKTYDLMVPFWPDLAKTQSAPTNATNDFAVAFDSVSKIVVFSKSLDQAEGKKTNIVLADLRERILKMKQQSGKDI